MTGIKYLSPKTAKAYVREGSRSGHVEGSLEPTLLPQTGLIGWLAIKLIRLLRAGLREERRPRQ